MVDSSKLIAQQTNTAPIFGSAERRLFREKDDDELSTAELAQYRDDTLFARERAPTSDVELDELLEESGVRAVGQGLSVGSKAGLIAVGAGGLAAAVPAAATGAAVGAGVGATAGIGMELYSRATHAKRLEDAKARSRKASPKLRKALRSRAVRKAIDDYRSRQDSPWQGGELGMMAGGLVGGVAGGMFSPDDQKWHNSGVGGVAGALSGAAIGALVGWYLRRQQRAKTDKTIERWKKRQEKTAMRAEFKFPKNQRLRTNAPATRTQTGGNPASASNKQIARGLPDPEYLSAGKPVGVGHRKLSVRITHKEADDFHHQLKLRLKQAGEENEPEVEDHSSAAQQVRPRAEVVAFTNDGVYGIDKGDYILFPGGGVDDGEPADHAAIRETIEEADLHLLNVQQRDATTAIWPEDSGNEFWDDSEFDGERTYFFIAVAGDRLGTQHPDREDFQLISFERLGQRFEQLINDPEQRWAQQNNRIRARLVREAKRLAEIDQNLRPIKMAEEIDTSLLDGREPLVEPEGWTEVMNSLQKILPAEAESALAPLQQLQEMMDHHIDAVRPAHGGIRIVLKTHEPQPGVTAKDKFLAQAVDQLMGGQKMDVDSMRLTVGARPDGPAPGLLVDLDGTLVDPEWGEDGTLVSQTARPEMHRILEEFAQAGVRIVGVTNRFSPDDLPRSASRINREAMGLYPMLEDVIYCDEACDQHRKPAPDMLVEAIEHFQLSPVLGMVGDSPDDQGAAAAAGVDYFHPDDFMQLGSQVLFDENVMRMTKEADAVSLLPRQEFIQVDDDGRVLVRRGINRRFDFPTAGRGKKAPYEQPIQFIPQGGVEDPGYHGHEYTFNIASDVDPEFTGEWLPADQLLKTMYGSMGLSVNKPYRDLDRARARVINRIIRKRKKQREQADKLPAPAAVTVPPPAPAPTVVAQQSLSAEQWREKMRELARQRFSR